MLEFIEKILNTLKENGFPDKKVSLPTLKMYEAADKRELSFNKVIEELKNTIDIDVEITDEKVIFSQKSTEAPNPEINPFDKEQLFKQAGDMLKNMSPDQIKQMQDMFMNMTEEEKEELMEKGRDLGLI
ncbi:MAG: hypothetical protein CME62_05415 [Halobacteriovoraceae bacterium]|nr:hypothetical protein [Halobacteriovoraceae bacterium]|tara:strand:+ start:13950 stop:14336 length:387 start_codon:yes stop_codon:yes gene_type:complete